MPFADVPAQIARDFQGLNISLAYLTPTRLRDALRTDGRVHCSRLAGRYEVVLPLLQFCVSDMASEDASGEFVRRKKYRELAACPLLPMANEEIHCFPSSPRDQIVMATPVMHAVMPLLKGIFMHPTALQDIDIICRNDLLKETLHIEHMTTQFIKVKVIF